MAFNTMLAQRFFQISRCSNSRIPLKTLLIQFLLPQDRSKDSMAPGLGETHVFRRILQRRPLYESTMLPERTRSVPTATSTFTGGATGEKLTEKLRGMDIARGRLCLDGIICPVPPPVENSKRTKEVETEEGKSGISISSSGANLTVKDLKKLLRAAQMEMAKMKLREISRDWMEYSEFIEICVAICGNNRESGMEFAKMLDDSGTVIVLGNAVCLHPDQEIKTLVVKAVQGLIPLPSNDPNDPRKKELEVLEKQKAEIDRKAKTLVRRELWAGLGYFVVQTAAFMRLTFWELSWDVMEPICFYVTSAYCMAGYTFFLRTSKEPSFEGFFQSRFSSKQKRLMKRRNFDLQRYDELRRIFYPSKSSLFIETSFGGGIKSGDAPTAAVSSPSSF